MTTVSLSRIVERIGRNTPQCLPFDFPEAGILVPVTSNASRPELVLTRRTQHLSVHAGQVAFPGGIREESDSDLLTTALRETREEIGVDPERVEIVGRLSQVVSRHNILVSPYVGLLDDREKFTINRNELDAIFKVPIQFFLETKPVRKDKLVFRQFELHVPCFRYGEYEIWGMSAIVVVDFLNVACGANIDLRAP